MYLREMGSIPLLTPDSQVAVAKRIEHGRLRVLKTIFRAPLIVKEFLQVSKDLRTGSRSIKEIVLFDHEELTEEKIEQKTKETLKQIDTVAKLYPVAMKQAAKLERIPRSNERPYLRAWHALARTRAGV
jgi:RNA polymerase primary sigma factor